MWRCLFWSLAEHGNTCILKELFFNIQKTWSPAPEMSNTSNHDGDVIIEVRDGIGLVRLSRPHARNAMTLGMYARLQEITAGIEADGEIKVLVITGEGAKAFAAGTDIAKFRDFSTPEHALDYERTMDGVLGSIERCAVPTIAAIAGACTGGGAAIAACCDLRIASRDMRFGFPIARTLGNCLSVANLARVADIIGSARMKEIIFTARLIEADEALAIGLVSELLDDHDALMTRAIGLAKHVAGHAPLTLRATKEGLLRRRTAMAIADDDLILSCYMSDDFREGLEAFLGKRSAVFKGR